MERCPSCRARLDGDATCRRCGMELTTLIEAEDAAERLVQLGVAHLAAGDTVAARGEFVQALALRRAPLAQVLLGFADKLNASR
ncbi:MAG: hypothetical protein LJE70_13755 [Chromatiaceae bacterium]|jgi:hypothetical protein|nr:hypothetical protein [Chromatiaceae bacterium]